MKDSANLVIAIHLSKLPQPSLPFGHPVYHRNDQSFSRFVHPVYHRNPQPTSRFGFLADYSTRCLERLHLLTGICLKLFKQTANKIKRSQRQSSVDMFNM